MRKQIVHNAHVVAELERRGAIFVSSEHDVPPGATVVFSAHGVAPTVHDQRAARGLHVIDATCPLVTKVHSEAQPFAGRGYTILLVGHEGHEEVVGTMGEAPEAIRLVGSPSPRSPSCRPRPEHAARLPHADDAVGRRDARRSSTACARASRSSRRPPKDDICYATSNRQAAVKALAREVDLVLVIGSRNSSNSNRLVEVARDAGVPSHLIEDESAIDEAWLEGVETVGITSGASAPESLVRRVVTGSPPTA